jgi:MoxR-like ATPase
MQRVQEFSQALQQNVERVIVGKPAQIQLAIICLLSQGHLLIDDVPGVGKTMLARSLAESLGVSFKRIQFTPDMLPSDITGVSIYNRATEQFEFRPGPIMSSIVLADEINRATPKTQSALLEAMQEQQVSVDGVTHKMPELYMVIATQNPLEYEGTFKLPEAQMDRFLMHINLGYPSLDDEIDVIDRQQFMHPIQELEAVVSEEQTLQAQAGVRSVYVAPSLKQYLVRIVQRTREHAGVSLGASPRGSLALSRASQAKAAIEGRDHVLPEDIKALAIPVLGHRINLAPGAHLENLDANAILGTILDNMVVPGGPYLSS